MSLVIAGYLNMKFEEAGQRNIDKSTCVATAVGCFHPPQGSRGQSLAFNWRRLDLITYVKFNFKAGLFS